jgi:hypothetical protein
LLDRGGASPVQQQRFEEAASKLRAKFVAEVAEHVRLGE